MSGQPDSSRTSIVQGTITIRVIGPVGELVSRTTIYTNQTGTLSITRAGATALKRTGQEYDFRPGFTAAPAPIFTAIVAAWPRRRTATA